MKKTLLLVFCCLPLVGTTCPVVSTAVPSIGVTCSNNPLDASTFGFKLTIPADFLCTTVEPNPRLLVSTRYRQNSTGYVAAVNLAAPIQDCNTNGISDATDIASNPSLDANNNGILDTCDGCGNDPTCQEQNPITTANNVTFRMFRVADANGKYITYLATTTVPSGNSLGITVSVLSAADSPVLAATLNTIIQSVMLVP